MRWWWAEWAAVVAVGVVAALQFSTFWPQLGGACAGGVAGGLTFRLVRHDYVRAREALRKRGQ